jgi:hypothetical protein
MISVESLRIHVLDREFKFSCVELIADIILDYM